VLLVRYTNSGTDRSSGGRFERRFLSLEVFGDNGLLRHWEHFHTDSEAEALARLDALTAPRGAARRPVRPNAATASVARLDAAAAAKDVAALHALFAEDMQEVHHPTGTRFGGEGALSRFDSLMRADGLQLFHEPIAVLGDSLVLCRAWTSVQGLADDDIAPAGPIESETRLVIGVDARGRACRVEIFAENHLGDAIACLYARYAALLPEGEERARAEATARAVADLMAPLDLERYAAALAPDVEYVDHRRVGLGSVRGSAALLRGARTLMQTATDFGARVADVLALRGDALLTHGVNFGRVGSGGAYESHALQLWCFGADGRLVRLEEFDDDRVDEALARFEALDSVARPSRRVRPNAATAFVARLDAAVAGKDAPALRREGTRVLHEPLASLGDALALCRVFTAGDALGEAAVPAGPFETDTRAVVEVDAQGQERAVEVFAEDHLGDAIACLYARYAELLPEGAERERAQATARTVATVLSSPDPARYAQVIAPDIEVRDRRRAGVGTLRGAEAYLEGLRALLAVAKPHERSIDDVLALRSDALLVRVRNSGTLRAGGGGYETIFLILFIFGADGRETRNEQFDADREAEALARFDELVATPAPRFENAASRAQAPFERAWRERDWDAIVAHFAPGFEMDDRRAHVGLPLAGKDFFTNLRFLAQSPSSRFDAELIATRGERLVLYRARFRGDLQGGSFEDEHLALVERDERGRAVAVVSFDLADLDAAYAELDRRFAAGEGAAYPEILAALDALRRNGPDTPRSELSRPLADDFRMESHRRFARTESPWTREQYVDEFRGLSDLGVRTSLRLDHVRISSTALIADGLWSGRRDDGDFELPHVIVYAHDGRLFHSCDLYDGDQLVAAQARFAELSARARSTRRENLATRSEQRTVEATVARDWEAFAALFPPRFRSIDRRKLMRLELGGEEFLAGIRPSFDIIAHRESEILATRGDRLALMRVRLMGRDGAGGPSEVELVQVLEVDEQGERIAAVGFDPDDVDEAYAELERRHAELSASSRSERPLENTATRTVDRLGEALEALDFARIRAFFAPGFRHLDRGRNAQVESGLDAYLDALRPMLEELSSSHLVVERLATRGDRLSLSRSRWLVSGDSVGPSEIEWLDLIEVDAEQRVALQVSFDPEDLDAAYAELDARFADAPGERRASLTRAFTQAFRDRDWDALAALLAPDLVVADHRRLGWETLRGPQAYVDALRSLVELAPDVRLRVEHAEMSEPGYLYFTSWQGTREGGAFEEPSWIVCELDAQGRIRAFDQYDLEQQAEARARLAEIDATRVRNALHIPPNAATRADDRLDTTRSAQDWAAFTGLCSEALEFDDRRQFALTRGGRDMFVANARWMESQGIRLARQTLIATAGDRLALQHSQWAGSNDEVVAFNLDCLLLTQVGADGRIEALVVFDPGDRRAASLEMFERYARGEGARRMPAAALEVHRAANAHDLDRLRAVVPRDFTFHDHRRTGLGRIEGGDAFVDSLSPLFEQSPDLTFEWLYLIAIEEHAQLSLSHMFGTLAGGGGELEGVYLQLDVFRDDRLVAIEGFEPERLEAARARFEALRPRDALRIQPNLATRASQRWDACIEARDWEGLTELFTPDFRFDDRRPLLRDSGDREMMVASVKIATLANTRAERTLVATAGERIALEHLRFSVVQGGSTVFEIETLQLTEVREDGRIVGTVSFDPGDRRSAFAELRERFVHGEGARWIPPLAFECSQALNAHELERARAAIHPEFVYWDHRRAGAARLEGSDAYLDWVRTLFEVSPDAIFTPLYYLALASHGSLCVAQTSGTDAEGGEFSTPYIQLMLFRDGRPFQVELFELDDLDQARARFEAAARA
jgi:ketosteroid isomerase-like protein